MHKEQKKPGPQNDNRSLLIAGENCEHITQASHIAMLVDTANYYRPLYEAICKARHSIFVLGWDIDSRIRLLRGEDASNAKHPTRFFNLIRWKARNNPDLKIYLNRWHFSLYMLLERELFAGIKWRFLSPPNVSYCLDGKAPFGSCHHQKVVVIDDEIAFCGGMDIAQCRWDHRQHHPLSRQRVDPHGTWKSGWQRFGPYHDINIMVSGPVVKPLAQLVRQRWLKATGKEPVALRNNETSALPASWPVSGKQQLANVQTGIACTYPEYGKQPAVHHVEQLYLDMIARAETFIYMENQYYTDLSIAKALNQRLKQCHKLRVLFVSSYNPQGIMERKVMWNGRLHFYETVKAGVEDRVKMTYPITHENDIEKDVRIHSKLMIVDDRWLRVGSSNLNRRSMGLDTECDLVIEAEDEKNRRSIAMIRNDLIREHTGRELKDIESFIQNGSSLDKLLQEVSHSRQHLRPVNDEKYRSEYFTRIATWIGDPKYPFFTRKPI
jgi:phospholipase D1/2